MTEPVLEVKRVTKSFKTKTVLNNIDLEVDRGRVVGLLGRNGAGKTKLLKCALGLLRVSSGTAKVFGEDSWDLTGEAKARIGYAPQEPDLYDWMRVGQMIAFISAFYSKWSHLLVSTLVRNWELNPDDKIGHLS